MNKKKKNDGDNITLDEIVKYYPGLKGKKEEILHKISEVQKNSFPKEMIVEGIIINDKKYYKDCFNCLLDENCNVIGLFNNEKSIIFDELDN